MASLIHFLLVASAAFVVVSSRFSSKEADTIRIINESSRRNEDDKVFENATKVLRESYIESATLVSKSRDNLLSALEIFEKTDNPEEALQPFNSAFDESLKEFLNSGIPPLKSLGIALGLIGRRSSENFEVASQLIQKGGLSTANAINAAKYLLTQGIKTKGNAFDSLLESVRLSIETSFAAPFANLQKSIQIANDDLRNTGTQPSQKQEKENCEAGQIDGNASNRLNDIDELANDALDRGAELSLVEELRAVLNCSVIKFVNTIAEGKQAVIDARSLSENDPIVALTALIKQEVYGINRIYEIASRIYNVFGYIASKTNNERNPKIDEAILGIEQGEVITFAGIENVRKIIAVGQANGPDARELGFEAALESGSFAEFALSEAIVKSAKIVFSLL